MILGGIILCGYQLSRDRTIFQSEYENPPSNNDFIIVQPDISVDTDPTSEQESGIFLPHTGLRNGDLGTYITPNKEIENPFQNVPYFTSERTQNTNDGYKDAKLSMFSGVDNIEYNKKSDYERTHFEPSADGGRPIYGSTFEPDLDRYKNYIANATRNDLAPCEQQQVGPGLGIEAGKVAEGGFHQNFRIRPDNVNVYRKNNLSTLPVNCGKAMVENPTSGTGANDAVTDPINENDLRMLGERAFDYKHGAGASAPTNRSNHSESVKNHNRSIEFDTSSSFSAMASPGQPGTYYTGSSNVHVEPNTLPSFPGGISSGNQFGIGAYTNERYNLTANDNRGVQNAAENFVQGGQIGSYYNNNGDVNMTMRGSETCPGMLTNVSDTRRHVATDNTQWDAKPTLKPGSENCYTGQAFGGHTGDAARNETVRNTLRGTARHHTEGPGGALVPVGQSYDSAYSGGDSNTTSRELTLVSDYTPNGCSQTHSKLDTVNEFKHDNSTNTIVSNPMATGINNFTSSSQIGSVIMPSKTVEENTRDFGYRQPENPFVIDITREAFI